MVSENMIGVCDRCGNKRIVLERPFQGYQPTSPDFQAFLEITYFKYLCIGCLEQLKGNVDSAFLLPFPLHSRDFVEGVHYYIQNGLFVFTEKYHIQKGYCCGNGCRHCPYGFNQE